MVDSLVGMNKILYWVMYRFESCPDYTFRDTTTDSVPNTMRNGVMTVWEPTLEWMGITPEQVSSTS